MIAPDARADNSLLPQSELPINRQYRHCGLLRHIGDDAEAGEFRSIPARTALKQHVSDLKNQIPEIFASPLDLCA